MQAVKSVPVGASSIIAINANPISFPNFCNLQPFHNQPPTLSRRPDQFNITPGNPDEYNTIRPNRIAKPEIQLSSQPIYNQPVNTHKATHTPTTHKPSNPNRQHVLRPSQPPSLPPRSRQQPRDGSLEVGRDGICWPSCCTYFPASFAVSRWRTRSSKSGDQRSSREQGTSEGRRDTKADQLQREQSIDSYMNIQLSDTKEYINRKFTGALGQVLIR